MSFINLPISTGLPALAIKEANTPDLWDKMQDFEEKLQQGLGLDSPRLRSSMDDYTINYFSSLAIDPSARCGKSSDLAPKPRRSSSSESACGLGIPRRSSSMPPTFREMIGNKGAVEPNLGSTAKDSDHGNPHEPLSNLSIPRIDFYGDRGNGSSQADGSAMTEMAGAPMEHVDSRGEVLTNTTSTSNLPLNLFNLNQLSVTIGPLANKIEDGSLNSSIEELRLAAKLARALEDPYEYNEQNRVMAEYEELNPLDVSYDFTSNTSSPIFALDPTEDRLVFQFNSQIELGAESESSTAEHGFTAQLVFDDSDGSVVTKISSGNRTNSSERIHMETDILANAGSYPVVSINVANLDWSDVDNGLLADRTVDANAPLFDDSTAITSDHLTQSNDDSIEERRLAAKLARELEEPYEYNQQNRIMMEFEEQLTPLRVADEFVFIQLSPFIPLSPIEGNNWEDRLVFQFDNQVRLEDSDGLNPTAPEADDQDSLSSIHERRLAAKMARQLEPEYEFNGQNRLMKEFEAMDPVDVANEHGYSCSSPVFWQGQAAGETSHEDEDSEALQSFSPIVSSPMDIGFGTICLNKNADSDGFEHCTMIIQQDNRWTTGSLSNSASSASCSDGEQQSQFASSTEDRSSTSIPTSGSGQSIDSGDLISIEDRFHLAEEAETDQVFFNQQRFVMTEYETNEPMDITNGIVYTCSSPTFVTSSPDSAINTSFIGFDLQDSENEQSLENNVYISWSELICDQESPTSPDDIKNENSDDRNDCHEVSGECKSLLEMVQDSWEKSAEPASRRVAPPGEQETFQESELSGLPDPEQFSAPVLHLDNFDQEDDELFVQYRGQQLASIVTEGSEIDAQYHYSDSSIETFAISINVASESDNWCELMDDQESPASPDFHENEIINGSELDKNGSFFCQNSTRMDQDSCEESADPTGQGIASTGLQGDFQDSELSGLPDLQHTPAGLQTCNCFDEEEEDNDDEVFLESNDEQISTDETEEMGSASMCWEESDEEEAEFGVAFAARTDLLPDSGGC